ncbi:hypothetical protein F5B21DRAFT_39783 [Xylaria acuta]|nr:hypothetical protein F5B21DRAFT_39783 [Xylaria acuta]
MITAVRSWHWRRDFCGYPQLCATARSFESFLLLSRPFIQALFGLHLLFSLFRGISVRVLCFAPHGSAMIIHWYSNAQIWSLIFEGKGVTTCALRPFNGSLIGITRLGITTSLHQAIGRTLSFSIGGPFSISNGKFHGVKLVGDMSSSINTTGRQT